MKTNRIFNIITVILFAALTVFFSALLIFGREEAISENENRPLALSSSVFSGNVPKRLISGALTDSVGDWCRDQFPLRERLLLCHALADCLLMRYETGGVMLGSEGYLIKREDAARTDILTKNALSVKAFENALADKEIPLVFAVAGRKSDVLDAYFPAYYSAAGREQPWEALSSSLGFDYLNLSRALKEASDAGEYVYYKTDHHWTTRGAYTAYKEIARGLGVTAYPESFFTVESISADFYGTDWSAAMTMWVPGDILEYWRYSGDEFFTLKISDSGSHRDGFYDLSYLDTKDKYASFLGGNKALVYIEKKGEEDRQTLVVVKDSYAHSVVPFLALHYNLVIVDPRYYTGSVYSLVKESGAEKVLILCGIDTLVTSDSFKMLRIGLG